MSSDNVLDRHKPFFSEMDHIIDKHTQKIYEDIEQKRSRLGDEAPKPSEVKDLLWYFDSDLSEGWETWYTSDGEDPEAWH